MSIAFLPVRQSLKVLGDLEPHDAGRGVSQISLELLGVHGDVSSTGTTQADRDR